MKSILGGQLAAERGGQFMRKFQLSNDCGTNGRTLILCPNYSACGLNIEVNAIPNPAQEQVRIDISKFEVYEERNSNSNNTFQYICYDLFGNVLVSDKFIPNQEFLEIETSHFLNGLYFFEVQHPGGVTKTKFVVSH